MADTHFSKLTGRVRTATSSPASPVAGDEYYHTSSNAWCRYTGSNWLCVYFSSTSSSSSSSTTTSTSTSTS